MTQSEGWRVLLPELQKLHNYTMERLEDALPRLAQMEEEKQHRLFMEEVSRTLEFI